MKAAVGFVRREWPVIAWAVSFAVLAFVIVQNYDLSQSIQDNRLEFIREECQDVNDRNTRTKESLEELAQQEIKRHPDKEGVVRANQASTELLIDALVPLRDCEQIVRLAEIDS